MEPRELAFYLADLLEEKLASEIIVIDVEELVGYTSCFVIASGRSDRQVQALADHLRRAARTHGGQRALGTEGTENGRWALIDYGDVIVHIFREDERDHYDLEGLWQDAPRLERPSSVGQAAT